MTVLGSVPHFCWALKGYFPIEDFINCQTYIILVIWNAYCTEKVSKIIIIFSFHNFKILYILLRNNVNPSSCAFFSRPGFSQELSIFELMLAEGIPPFSLIICLSSSLISIKRARYNILKLSK